MAALPSIHKGMSAAAAAVDVAGLGQLLVDNRCHTATESFGCYYHRQQLVAVGNTKVVPVAVEEEEVEED